jgi:hypothetical protein
LNEHVAGLIRQYRNKGLLLDTVLFVLLAAGIYNRKLVGNDKRLKAYVPEDIETLIAFVKLFDPLITTPNTVTEVSNLTGHLWATQFPMHFAQHIEVMEEHYFPSKTAIRSELFGRFGLTDTAITEIARGKYLILTDDFRLAGYLEQKRVDVVNFNHIRTLNW